MAKLATIFHGTDGTPDINWLPWVKRELEAKGYEVYAPLLPKNHTPNKTTYSKFLQKSGWNFTNNLLIGHSSGATTILNLLDESWFPKVDKTILVGTFLNERALNDVAWYEPGQFDNLFPKAGFNVKAIIEKAGKIYFIHGSNDPYCLLEDTAVLVEQTGGELIAVKDGLHLSSNRKELPELLPLI